MPPIPSGLADAIGYLAAALTTASRIPQIMRTWRLRSAGDLSSLGMLATFTLGIALWLVFGSVVAANTVTLLLNLVLVGLRLHFGAAPRS
ncbi:MAG: PQ-loop repeat-containing protein [Deltaproteobacteria bacterium]|nr:PQ-loop repeat-containing protein [Deltaproteobacteria bacterium]